MPPRPFPDRLVVWSSSRNQACLSRGPHNSIGSTMIRRLSVLILSAGLSLALVLAPSASSADESTPNPVDQVVKTVQDLVEPKDVQTADHADAPDPPAEDDDLP